MEINKQKKKKKEKREVETRYANEASRFSRFCCDVLANPVTDSARRTASHDPRWAISRSILDPRENTVPEICGNGFLDWRYRFSKITGEKPRRGNMWYSTDKCPLLFADERSSNRPPCFFLFVRIRGKDTAIICTSDLQKLKRMSLHYDIQMFSFFFYGFDYSSRFREMNVSEKELFLTFSVVRGNRAFRNYVFEL